MTNKVSPTHGGCWFCFKVDNNMVFDTEFDTWLHLDCLKQALKDNPNDPEAQFMLYLLEKDNDKE